MTRSIVVGVDGSPGAVEAARYGAAMAERRHATLTLVHVFETVFYGYGPVGFAGSYALSDERLRESGAKLLEETGADIATTHPDLKVDSRLKTGGAAARLIEESADAEVTVVGSRGMGGFARLMLGSVSTQVAAYGHGPIVVVRPATVPHGPVLVGYDGSAGAGAALKFGVQEATSRGVPLVVAHIYWEQPAQPDQSPGRQPSPDPMFTARQNAQQLINEALEVPSRQHPKLRYDVRTIYSVNPAHSLVEESAKAGLTVVGSRGLGGFTGLLLGSVSRTLIHHAAGPVAVVHPTQH